MKIIKNSEKRTATFVILEPEIEDRNGDIISADEIIETAHEFFLNSWAKSVNLDHTENSDIDDVRFVESFVAPVDLEIWGETIKKGSWLVAFRFFSDERWKQLEDGYITGVSMEGYGFSI